MKKESKKQIAAEIKGLNIEQVKYVLKEHKKGLRQLSEFELQSLAEHAADIANKNYELFTADKGDKWLRAFEAIKNWLSDTNNITEIENDEGDIIFDIFTATNDQISAFIHKQIFPYLRDDEYDDIYIFGPLAELATYFKQMVLAAQAIYRQYYRSARKNDEFISSVTLTDLLLNRGAKPFLEDHSDEKINEYIAWASFSEQYESERHINNQLFIQAAAINSLSAELKSFIVDNNQLFESLQEEKAKNLALTEQLQNQTK